MRKIVFTRRALLGMRGRLGIRSVNDMAGPFSSLFGSVVHGSQLCVLATMPLAHKFPGHPAYRPAQPIHLEARVGSDILCICILHFAMLILPARILSACAAPMGDCSLHHNMV